jgi:nitrite reductase (NADH) small subunit
MSTTTSETRSTTTARAHGEVRPPSAGPAGWTTVCDLARVPREGGVAAVVAGHAVAVFRTHDDRVFVLGNIDPASKASVMSRGIVGSKGGVPFVASPLFKHPWNLQTGRRLDDPEQRLPTHPARVIDGLVVVGPRA